MSTLYALERIGYKGSEEAMIKLRDYRCSFPQLDDKSGLDQMSEECNTVLKSLSGTGPD